MEAAQQEADLPQGVFGKRCKLHHFSIHSKAGGFSLEDSAFHFCASGYKCEGSPDTGIGAPAPLFSWQHNEFLHQAPQADCRLRGAGSSWRLCST